jgi:hypothetical protein
MTAVSNKNHYVPGHNGVKVVTSILGHSPINMKSIVRYFFHILKKHVNVLKHMENHVEGNICYKGKFL